MTSRQIEPVEYKPAGPFQEETRICPHCGRETASEGPFCNKCGMDMTLRSHSQSRLRQPVRTPKGLLYSLYGFVSLVVGFILTWVLNNFRHLEVIGTEISGPIALACILFAVALFVCLILMTEMREEE